MATKEMIKSALRETMEALSGLVATASEQSFKSQPNGKWGVAQQTDHLSIANYITASGFAMPKPVLKTVFKSANRISQPYDEVVWRYQQQLSQGAKAPLPFQPVFIRFTSRTVVQKVWANSCEVLLKATDNWTEEELDAYLLPHPILGKITARELLLFTVYHIRHHYNSMKAMQTGN